MATTKKTTTTKKATTAKKTTTKKTTEKKAESVVKTYALDKPQSFLVFNLLMRHKYEKLIKITPYVPGMTFNNALHITGTEEELAPLIEDCKKHNIKLVEVEEK